VFNITVTNVGPGVYNDQIVIEDIVPANTTPVFLTAGWPCTAAPPYTCSHDSILNPGDSVTLQVRVDVSDQQAKALHCKVKNEVKIASAPGGSNSNTNPGDDQASAIANIPAKDCQGPPPPAAKTNLKIEKSVIMDCQYYSKWQCYFLVKVT